MAAEKILVWQPFEGKLVKRVAVEKQLGLVELVPGPENKVTV